MDKKMKVFVVILAYQAVATIAQVFARLPAALGSRDITCVVIDDGSRDGTGEEVERIAASRKAVLLIRHEENRGYAPAQKTGFLFALKNGADIVALLHADGQYAPELLPELLAPIESGEADLVQGSRMMRPRDALLGGMPMNRWLGNLFLTALENQVYGLRMAEYHSGYMLYSRRTLLEVPFLGLSNTFHFDGEMLFVAAKRGLRTKEIAIPTRYAAEKSHLNPVKYGFTVLGIMAKYLMGRYDPDMGTPLGEVSGERQGSSSTGMNRRSK